MAAASYRSVGWPAWRPARSARCSRSTASRPWWRWRSRRRSRLACQSIGPTPTRSSSQLIRPNSRPKSIAKTIATAAVEVMFGIEMAIRQHGPAAQPPVQQRWPASSASSSCGTVESTKMPKVLTTAFQKCGSSASSSAVVVQRRRSGCVACRAGAQSCSDDPERVDQRVDAEDREEQEERRDVEVRREAQCPAGSAAGGAPVECGGGGAAGRSTTRRRGGRQELMSGPAHSATPSVAPWQGVRRGFTGGAGRHRPRARQPGYLPAAFARSSPRPVQACVGGACPARRCAAAFSTAVRTAWFFGPR